MKTYESSIPLHTGSDVDLVDFKKSGLGMLFLYGAMECGELHPTKAPDGRIMVQAKELQEALKQDRYAYIEVADRLRDRTFVLMAFLVAPWLLVLLSKLLA